MSLFRPETGAPANDGSAEDALAARLARVRAAAEAAQTSVDESAEQYAVMVAEQVDFHANYVPAYNADPAFAGAPAPAPAPGLPAAPSGRRGLLCDADDECGPLLEARAPPPAAASDASDDEDGGAVALAASPRRRGGVLDDGAADAPVPRRAARGGILDDGAAGGGAEPPVRPARVQDGAAAPAAATPAAKEPTPPRPSRPPPVLPGPAAASAPARRHAKIFGAAPAKPAPARTSAPTKPAPARDAAPQKPVPRRRPRKVAASEPRIKHKPTTADRMREKIQTKRVQIAKENLERLLRGENEALETLAPRPKNFRA